LDQKLGQLQPFIPQNAWTNLHILGQPTPFSLEAADKAAKFIDGLPGDALPYAVAVDAGLGRVVALRYCSSTSYQIH
jgi:hypothetical protein